MKRIISIILAMVMALSMSINCFAVELGESEPTVSSVQGKKIISISKPVEEASVLYATMSGKYYIALEDEPYRNIRITSNGCLSAIMLDFDPETMEVQGMDIVYGVKLGDMLVAGDMTYDQAKAYAKQLNEENNSSDYEVVCLTNVNILEITTMDNYTPNYMRGNLKIYADLNGIEVSQTYTLIEDVTVFNLEEVKAAAKDFSYGKYLETGSKGYSGYVYDITGEIAEQEDAAVVSAEAFRAIEGESLRIYCGDMMVNLKNISASQKGVNFKYYGNYEVDTDSNGVTDLIQFGFFGNQTIFGDFTVQIETGYTWGSLSEAFGIDTEENPEVSYYILKNGVIATQIRVNYDLADPDLDVVLEMFGSNETLGNYEIVLEAPAMYKLFFNLGDGEWVTRRYYPKTEGVDFVIPEIAPTRKWHTFLGWATSEDAAEPEYLPGDVYSLNEDKDFYAIWRADEEAKTKLSATSAVSRAGNTAKIKVELSEPAGATCIQFGVKYAPGYLDVVSCNPVLLPDATVNYSEDGMIYFVWEDVNSLEEGGTLLEIEFEVASYAPAGDVKIDIAEDRNAYEMIFADADGKEFRAEAVDGNIKVVEVIYGDLNGDEKINVLDANMIRRYSAKLVSLDDNQLLAADVDGNGKVNVLDANLIRRYSAKLIDKFPVE